MDIANIAVWAVLEAAEQDARAAVAARQNRKRNGGTPMNNELVERYVGCECYLALGTSGGNLRGTILSLRENWIELQEKKGVRLVNTDYVSSIQPAR